MQLRIIALYAGQGGVHPLQGCPPALHRLQHHVHCRGSMGHKSGQATVDLGMQLSVHASCMPGLYCLQHQVHRKERSSALLPTTPGSTT